MNPRSVFKIFTLLLTIQVCIITVSCKSRSAGDDLLVLTEVPAAMRQTVHHSGIHSRYLPEARISSVKPGKQDSHRILTGDFYSACWPDISYNGKFMLFAAQEQKDQPWQIYEMNLKNHKYRKVISVNDNCTDPAYLPGDRLVFSKLTLNDTVKSAHCLYTCNLDGSGLRQITFSPCDNYATTVLKDGRILTVNTQLLPDHGNSILMTMRPDGTKADMFYMNKENGSVPNNPRETDDGRIIFIEYGEADPHAGQVVSISYNQPLHSRIELTQGTPVCYSVTPVGSDKYLATGYKPGEERVSLYEFDPANKTAGELVFTDPEYDIYEAVPATPIERPKNLPSEVDLLVKTGLLLCQDVNLADIETVKNKAPIVKASMIEALGVDSTYGVVPLEADGSFQLKVLADMPFRILSLDENGRVVNGPSAWLWLRPNERRGCVGCHEDPELVPFNRIPLAVKIPPVIIPVSVTEIKEKIVELE